MKLKTSDDALVKQIQAEAGKTLAKIDGVRGVWIGKPAENGTPELAQRGYHLGIVVLLDDSASMPAPMEPSATSGWFALPPST